MPTDPETPSPSPAQDRLATLHHQLVEQVQALRTSDDWTAWLQMAARLHQYSFRNVLLIAAQRPDATTVAGYRAWQDLGRQVGKGEHGIRILVPVTRRIHVDEPSTVSDGSGSDGDAPEHSRVVGYRVGYVWDLAQTHGRPLPQQPLPTVLGGSAPDGLWDRLAARVTAEGFSLSRGPCGGANGVTDLAARTVRVRDDVDDAQAVKTLAHELAHVLLHSNRNDFECRGVIEVEAESVAYLVTAAHNLPTDTYTFPYVLGWATAVPDNDPLEVVSRVGERVVRAAHVILTSHPAPADPPPATSLATTALRADRPNDASDKLTATPHSRGRLLAVHEDAAMFFEQYLAASWVPEYLDGRRLGDALTDQTWRVGYAPGGWTSLVDHLRALGYSDDTLETSGLALRVRTGRLADRFRDRLTLAIRDQEGQVIGFVGRASPDAPDTTPKYLNSPTTPTYRKGQHLFGAFEASVPLRAGAVPVLTEGPLDAIAVGLAATSTHAPLALCGTTLTVSHVDELARLTSVRKVVVALDADAAGRRAAEAAYFALRRRGFMPLLAELPPGNDPAGVLAAQGPLRLSSALGSRATPLADRLVEDLIGDFAERLRWVEGQIAAIRAVAPLVASCDPVHRQSLTQQVARWTGVSGNVATLEVAAHRGAERRTHPHGLSRSLARGR